MDTQHEETITTYVAKLKAKASHLTAMSAEQRVTLREQWTTLVEEVKAAVDEDPGSPKAQRLLDRWLSFLQALTGAASESTPLPASPELPDELWSRRAEWLPAEAARESVEVTNAGEALARLRERIRAFADSDVLKFIERARVARALR